ncbi:MAG: cytochrome c [Candidatus Eisenbacteria bacterium]|uniref:Cytochrome c n=1 Tax=Eiseniibacteriota bacterium TaxID=2212470 RepID=A0A956N9L4_UNCEI|nr:cytochrome c [Candidatus Eisenbacteria bacterium]MCB9464924.1 cytochrome c [Candidatus Eisenbacteria bacterium]
MPRWAIPTLVLLLSLALVPALLITRARSTQFRQPRVHLIPDMDHQFKYKAQQENPIFEDHRAMRLPVEGTVARGELREDTFFYLGTIGDDWATTFPFEITRDVMARGKQRHDIYCAPCHGLDGSGMGTVAVRAQELQEPKWVPPASFHTELVLSRPVGHLFNTITNGIRNMPAYGPQIEPADRWAIVAYVRALQKSQNATLEDVPADVRPSLR